MAIFASAIVLFPEVKVVVVLDHKSRGGNVGQGRGCGLRPLRIIDV